MTGRKRNTLGAAIAMGAAVLLAVSAVPAEANDGHRNERGRNERVDRDHGRAERVYRRDGGRWVAPPLLARPHRLPRPRSFTVPRQLRAEHRRAYSPYFAGRVFYAPYGVNLDLYYFPVWVGGSYVYVPHYYYGNELVFSVGAGGPHFFFHIGF